jgi:hypothetical protein
VYASRTHSRERSPLEYFPLNYGDLIGSGQNVVSLFIAKFEGVTDPKLNSQEEWPPLSSSKLSDSLVA